MASPGCTFRWVAAGWASHRQISSTRCADSRSSAPRARSLRNVIGYGMVAPTLVIHGTDEQKRRFLRPLFTGEEIWCQLFTEPGAGSDVAALATRARARRRRMDPHRPEGVDDARARGRVRAPDRAHEPRRAQAQGHHRVPRWTCARPASTCVPLYQVTGEAEFNECFFSEARVPDALRLGGVGEGWGVSITTLMNERVSIGGTVPPQGLRPHRRGDRIWRQHWAGRRDAHAMAVRSELLQAWVRNEVARLTNWRASDLRRAGTPGPEGSVAKLAFAEENQRTSELCVDLLGVRGHAVRLELPAGSPDRVGDDRRRPAQAFFRMRANSIEGGTSEVMRNIIGERVLGLPGEPRADKDLAVEGRSARLDAAMTF